VDVEAIDFAGEGQVKASNVEANRVIHGGDDIGGHYYWLRSGLCCLLGMDSHLSFMFSRIALLQRVVLLLGDGAIGEKNVQ